MKHPFWSGDVCVNTPASQVCGRSHADCYSGAGGKHQNRLVETMVKNFIGIQKQQRTMLMMIMLKKTPGIWKYSMGLYFGWNEVVLIGGMIRLRVSKVRKRIRMKLATTKTMVMVFVMRVMTFITKLLMMLS